MVTEIISAIKSEQSTKLTDLRTSSKEESSSLTCYHCATQNSNCVVDETTLVRGCKACMLYLNTKDGGECMCAAKNLNRIPFYFEY